MPVRIRLQRGGVRNRPCYRIVAANSRSPRDGKHLEILGFYNPLLERDHPKRFGLKIDRAKHWLSVGAQPSDPARKILVIFGVLPPLTRAVNGVKSPPAPNGRMASPHDDGTGATTHAHADHDLSTSLHVGYMASTNDDLSSLTDPDSDDPFKMNP